MVLKEVFNNDEEIRRKFTVLKNNHLVATNGHIFHCPVTDCFGLVDPKKFAPLAIEIYCNECN
jgi:hypothetical protein